MTGENQKSVQVEIKPAQLRLMARLMQTGMDYSILSHEEAEEAALLIGCCLDTADKPGEPGEIHGFCL